MSNLLKKSSASRDSAVLLMSKADCHNSAPHCIYYSCYQLVNHVLRNIIRCHINLNKNSHEQTINALTSDIAKTDPTLSNTINTQLGSLKRARVHADYHDRALVNNTLNQQLLTLSDKTCREIRTFYGII